MNFFRFILIAFLIAAVCFPLPSQDPAETDRKTPAVPRTIALESILGKDCRSLLRIRKDNCLPTAGGDKTFTPVLTWSSSLKREAVYPGLKNAPKLTFLGRDVLQLRLQFQNAKLDGLYVLLFASGKKNAPLNTADFSALWKSLADEFANFTGGPCYLSCDICAGGIEFARLICAREQLYCELKARFAGTKDPVMEQIIEFSVRPFEPSENFSWPDIPLKSVFDPPVKNPEPLLVRSADKSVYLAAAPMTAVKQGVNNESVVLDQFCRLTGSENASISAVSGYMAAASASGAMNWDAVRSAGTKFDLRLSDVYDRYKDVKNFEKLLDRYNRAAQKMRAIRLEPVYIPTGREWDPYRRMYREQLVLDVVATSAKMQPTVLRQMWFMEKNDFRRFQKTIRSYIDRGLPVGWCVMLPEEVSQDNDGLRKGRRKRSYRDENKTSFAQNPAPVEWNWPGTDPLFGRSIPFSPGDDIIPNPLTANGELRLIIGYNPALNVVLYLNPRLPDRIWSLPADLAWAVTSFFFIVRDKK